MSHIRAQDPFRKVVIELLLDKEGFKRAEVTEAANSQGIAVTDSLYNKVCLHAWC